MHIKTVISLGAFSLFLVFAAGSGEDQTPAQRAQDRQKGFHCLSAWDGSHREVVRQVEQRLRDPDSFEYIETRITPVNQSGEHRLIMEYRARNGFGGMTLGRAVATIENSDCSVASVSIE